MIHKLLILIVLSTLTGCSLPTALALNTPTPPPTVCISQPEPEPCVTSTSASSPLATKVPPYPTATLARSAQVIPLQPTPQPVETWLSTSPDGNWIAQGRAEFPATRGANATYHVQLQVARKDGSQMWTVVDQSLPYQSGYVTPEIFFWSDDGARMYFANLPHPDGCTLLYNARDLQRVDLATGRVQMIAPQVGFAYLTRQVFVWQPAIAQNKVTNIEGYMPALSPDETTVAYIAEGQPLQVVLRDLGTAMEKQVQLKNPDPARGVSVWSSDDPQAGAISWPPGNWSPGSYAILLSVFDHPCDPKHRNSTIVKLETDGWQTKQGLPQAILKQYDQRLMRAVRWDGFGVDIADGEGHSDLFDMRCPTTSPPGCPER